MENKTEIFRYYAIERRAVKFYSRRRTEYCDVFGRNAREKVFRTTVTAEFKKREHRPHASETSKRIGSARTNSYNYIIIYDSDSNPINGSLLLRVKYKV